MQEKNFFSMKFPREDYSSISTAEVILAYGIFSCNKHKSDLQSTSPTSLLDHVFKNLPTGSLRLRMKSLSSYYGLAAALPVSYRPSLSDSLLLHRLTTAS